MAYSTPSTQITGDLITAAIWNQNVVSNIIALTPGGFSAFIDGGGAAIVPDTIGWLSIPYKCDITRVSALPDQSGSIQFDLWNCTYSDYDAFSTHPADGDSICGGNELAISAGTKAEDSTLTSWTPAIAANDILAIVVDSCATIEKCAFCVDLQRS